MNVDVIAGDAWHGKLTLLSTLGDNAGTTTMLHPFDFCRSLKLIMNTNYCPCRFVVAGPCREYRWTGAVKNCISTSNNCLKRF